MGKVQEREREDTRGVIYLNLGSDYGMRFNELKNEHRRWRRVVCVDAR